MCAVLSACVVIKTIPCWAGLNEWCWCCTLKENKKIHVYHYLYIYLKDQYLALKTNHVYMLAHLFVAPVKPFCICNLYQDNISRCDKTRKFQLLLCRQCRLITTMVCIYLPVYSRSCYVPHTPDKFRFETISRIKRQRPNRISASVDVRGY